MARYAGRKGKVMIGATVGGAAVQVTLSEWSLDQTTERFDVTSFQDANKVYVQGLPDLQGSFSGFWDHSETTLFDAAGAAGAVNMYLYPSTDAAGIYWYGTAYIDASINTAVNGPVAISGSFAAASTWGKKLS
ncbi:MAG: hypothetical protein AB7Q16_05975 [Vicinamibacterales bacterium]